jgi:mono/diheme cytochrome c family protein
MITRIEGQLCVVLAAALLSSAGCSGAKAEDLSSYSGPGLFRTYCASCHGVAGEGDGPVASSLRVEVPDLTRIAHRQGGRFPADQVRKIIDGRTTLPPHGTRDMPVWGQAFRAAGALEPQDDAHVSRLIDLLVEYLRSIQRE